MSVAGTKRWKRLVRPLLVVALAVSAAVPVDAAHGVPSRFKEIGLLPLFADGPPASPGLSPDRSGWLILNPHTRRGYQVFEGIEGTVVQSFDLDSLIPLRRVALRGVPVTAGFADASGPGVTQAAGEIVHAVDEEGGRIYLAMSESGLPTVPQNFAATGAVDGQRAVTRLVMIDEAALDRGDDAFAASFRAPIRHAHLHAYWLLGLQVSRHHVGPSEVGKLFGLFAQPQAPLVTAPAYGHTLVQWDVAELSVAAGDESLDGMGSAPLADAGAGARVLEPCTMSSIGSPIAHGSYQWGLLATRDAVFLGCHGGPRDGTVVAVPLAADGALDTVKLAAAYPLRLPIADVLVDQGAERLVLRTVATDGTSGHRVVTFNAHPARFGPVAVLYQNWWPRAALGLDDSSGRLYALVPDHVTFPENTPVEGGLQYADTRVATSPSLVNVVPALAYPALFRIQVDPPTKRFFVRRGTATHTTTMEYPGTQFDTPASPERFYRVFEDKAQATG